jgi:hypothetical protein
VIRAVTTGPDGRRLLILGVDDENIKRLTSGQPLHVEGDPLGIPGITVVIMHGHSLQDVLDELKTSGVDLPVDRVPIAKPGHPVVLRGTKT